jgi:hypothetical protein
MMEWLKRLFKKNVLFTTAEVEKKLHAFCKKWQEAQDPKTAGCKDCPVEVHFTVLWLLPQTFIMR